jgi:hypothetical protein
MIPLNPGFDNHHVISLGVSGEAAKMEGSYHGAVVEAITP